MRQAPDKICNRPFIVSSLITFLALSNMALFFRFNAYLLELPLDPDWNGLIISMFYLVALLMRPFISHRFNADNAGRWIMLSSLGVAGCMLLYGLAQGLTGLLALRALHGLSHALLVTAITAPLVEAIPEGRSGEAFGIVTIINLLPMAVIPPLVIWLMAVLGDYPRVLAWAALLILPIAPLALLLRRGLPRRPPSEANHVLTWPELRDNLRDRRVLCLLGISLLVYTTFTPIFFFAQDFVGQRGMANPGWFFFASALTEIVSRLLLGRLFDRVRKTLLLSLALLLLTAAYLAMIHAQGQTMLLALALALGLGWGVGMPVLNALMFEMSSARFRVTNTNLGMFAFQAGFFLGPLLGGALLTAMGYTWLFVVCAALFLLALAMVPLLGSRAGAVEARAVD